MVLKKRLSYGSRSYYLPPIPHVPTSAKGKRTVRRKPVENPLQAFDMLATVAGNLLMDLDPVSDGAPNCSTLKRKPLDELEAPKTDSLDRSSASDMSALVSDLNPKTQIGKNPDLCINGYEEQFMTKQGETDDGLVRFNSSESSSELSLYSEGVAVARDANPCLLGTGLAVNRDDDENSCGCTDWGAMANKSSKRVKMPCVDKLKKVISRNKKLEAEVKVGNGSNRKCYAMQRAQKNGLKRRKLLYHSSVSSSGSQVRLSIKSFKVPELSIAIPESASIGTLKRTIIEALTAALEGELSIGVMLRGKKIRDDSRTLRQAGICSGSALLDSVGFTLEPELVHSPITAPHVSCDSVDTRDIMEPLVSIAPSFNASEDHYATPGRSPGPVPLPVPTTPVKSHVTDPDPMHSPMEVSSADQTAPQVSQAIILVAVPEIKVESLAIVPAVQELRQAEMLGQRRMRRPFSVAEVEALVAAVEKLGTGRWRDVKMRAFDDAKHRTYVDLKDKWKTLVHTASILPQQRRGEPVPQELLDRVLAAQAYWSHEHLKLSKASFGEPGLAEFDSSPYPMAMTSL